jgi:SAM-dependent methyltransferase
MSDLPLPPTVLIERVGAVEDPVGQYLVIAEHQRQVLEHYLPDDWSWAGKTFVDWGAGAGRLVRLFAEHECRVIAVDIDEPSIEWINAHLPGVQGITVDGPSLPLESGSVDLVTGLSVMTHITDEWAEWLLEIRRVLRPGGLAIFTQIGRLTGPLLLGERWDEDRVGMLVLRYGEPWTHGGPDVVHSAWWIREHWGRAFDVLSVEDDPITPEPGQHQYVVMSKPDSPPPTLEALERCDDPRHLAAAGYGLERCRVELAQMRVACRRAETAFAAAESAHEGAMAEVAALRATWSWRLTRPLRGLHR